MDESVIFEHFKDIDIDDTSSDDNISNDESDNMQEKTTINNSFH